MEIVCRYANYGYTAAITDASARTRRLNQVQSVLYPSMFFLLCCCLLGPLLCIVSFRCYVFCLLVVWTFWLSCQYLPSDWLERLL